MAVEGLTAPLTPSEWQASGNRVPLGDAQIFVRTSGHGEPLLLLHAFPTSSFDFCKIAPVLSERYRLILFDYPGFGFSEKPARYPYSLFRYADVAQAVLDYFGVRGPLRVLAHDIGDSVALELLRRGSVRIDRLVMLNGSVISIPFADPKMRLMQKALLYPVSGELVGRLRLVRKSMLRGFFRQIFASPLSEADLDAFWSLVCYDDGLKNYHRLMRYMPERWEHQETWLDALAAHSAPLTIIWGQADPVATPAVADQIVARRPDARAVRLENIGHYPHWEAPEIVAGAIQAGLV